MANYAILQHTESTNTNGGASSGGVQTRKLNNVAYDGIGITLSGNEFTFTNGGTYRITAKAACNAFGGHRLIVQDTNSSYNVLGLSGNNYEPSETMRDVDNSYAHITTPPITVAADDTYRLDHYAASDSATDSFGRPCGDGNDEIYAEVVIERLS